MDALAQVNASNVSGGNGSNVSGGNLTNATNVSATPANGSNASALPGSGLDMGAVAAFLAEHRQLLAILGIALIASGLLVFLIYRIRQHGLPMPSFGSADDEPVEFDWQTDGDDDDDGDGGGAAEGGDDDEPPDVPEPEPVPEEAGRSWVPDLSIRRIDQALGRAVRGRIEGRFGGGDGDDGDGFDPNWRAVGTVAGVAMLIALPLTVFYLRGGWPFGPWPGYTIGGFPLYWALFFGMLLFAVFSLPIYVYFIAPTIPGLGGAMPRLTWIIASWAQGGTIFDRSADGRYYARPLRQNPETEVAEMWVDGEWTAVTGNVEFVSRLAWRPIAFTWEKTGASVQEIRATDMGEDPVEYLVERGMMDRDVAEQFQPRAGAPDGTVATADGGAVMYDKYGAPVEEPPAVANGGEPPARYNILDYQGHAFQAYNPWPDGGDDDEFVIDTRKVMHKLAGAGETKLLQRAKDIALTDTAETTRMGQVLGWGMVFVALMMGVAVAYFTV